MTITHSQRQTRQDRDRDRDRHRHRREGGRDRDRDRDRRRGQDGQNYDRIPMGEICMTERESHGHTDETLLNTQRFTSSLMPGDVLFDHFFGAY